MSEIRVLVYVQHLLGIGHLKRAAAIARALAESGCTTRLVSGGTPVTGIELGSATLRQLPPLHATADFTDLLDENCHTIDAPFKASRRDLLLNIWQEFRPDVLITELFPFGRRQMRFELLPLLEAALSSTQPPVVLASIRDILQQNRKPQRVREALAWFDHYYRGVLVHADPDVVRLDESLPAVIDITDRIHYTGYVVDGKTATIDGQLADHGEVIVSAGGGAVGERLMRVALAAKPLTIYRDRAWRLLAGHKMPEVEFESLQRRAGPGVVVERARRDFPALLASSVLSISQCGYNTMTDIVGAGTRAVVVPFAGDGETEQTMRARIWAARGVVTIVAEHDLSAASLAAAVNHAVTLPPYDASDIDLEGAATTAKIVRNWVQQARPGA
ncbi:MAG: glycosyltransferase [Proteobacteria bacterium]|nr:glycosyltransferase [Pseudomonadota bacterium]